MKTNSWVVKTVSVLLILIGSISLFMAQSAYWVNHTVFNQSNFSSLVSEAVLEPESRDAIASQIVDRALQDRPVAQRLVGERAQQLVSSLLATDFSAQAINKVVNVTYKYVTTPDRQDIKLELAGITEPITAILNLTQARDSEAAQAIESIPDEIVLIESDSFVDLSGVVSFMLWFGPMLWLFSIVSFAVYIYLHRINYARAVYVVGASIIVVSILGLLTRPVLPPPIASMIPQVNIRPVAQNVTDAFLVPFQTQMASMLFVTVIVLIIFSQRRVISGWIQKLSGMVARENVPNTSTKSESAAKPAVRKKVVKKK